MVLVALAACSSNDGTASGSPAGGSTPGGPNGNPDASASTTRDGSSATGDGCVTPAPVTDACSKETSYRFTESVLEATTAPAPVRPYASIVVDDGGFFHAVWGTRGALYYATDRGGGRKVETVDTGTQQHYLDAGARIAVDRCGKVYIAYLLTAPFDDRILLAQRVGDHFEKLEIPAGNESPIFDMVLDGQGSPIVFTTGGSDWRIHRAANLYKAEDVPHPSSVGFTGTRIAFSSKLGVVIGMQPGLRGYKTGIVSSKDGGPWIESIRDTAVETFSSEANRIVAGPDGAVHMLYLTGDGQQDKGLHYSSIAAPNEWTPEVAVPLPKPVAGREKKHEPYAADILLAPSGKPRVVFRDYAAETPVPMITELGNGSFGPLQPIASETNPVLFSGTIDKNGRAYFVFGALSEGATRARLRVQDCAP